MMMQKCVLAGYVNGIKVLDIIFIYENDLPPYL
jgi:hypothetical protein